MWYCNARIFTPQGFLTGSFRVENGRFAEVRTAAGSMQPFSSDEGSVPDSFDLEGAKVLPGLIDIHTHGNSGADFSDGDPQGLANMARFLASRGITSFAPASMSLPYEILARAFENARQFHDHRPAGAARLAGIHMEGPFLSKAKKGAQKEAYLRDPDPEAFLSLMKRSGGLIRIADAAPELPGAAAFAEKIHTLCTVSAAHTDADYDTARAFFEAGASHVTHLFNAMSPMHHRAPGVIGGAAEQPRVTAELICDGLHVHPSAVRMAYKLFPGRICLVSDALRCCGMPDGEYELGGQTVFLKNSIARLADGTIAGAASDLMDDLRNAVRFGIPEEEAILSATLTPARVIRADRETGSIEPGKYADFLVCTENLDLQAVYIEGDRIL